MSIELKKVNSILDKIQLTEQIDQQVLNQLLNSNLLRTDSWQQNGILYENEKQQLLKYKALFKNDIATITYYITCSGYARVYANKSLSLGSIRKEVRHTLAKDRYVDIDIENCHPVILQQICNKNDIECKYLTKYVKDREALLQDVITRYNVTRDDAKSLFIALMYGGKFEYWSTRLNIKDVLPCKFIKCFAEELTNIAEEIANKNPKLTKLIVTKQKANGKDNMVGSLLSIFCQEYERQILECIFSYLQKKKFIINNEAVLCFDGIMILKEKYDKKVLKELHTEVQIKLGFCLVFAQKEMDKDYINQLIGISNKYNTIYYDNAENDLDACEKLYKMYPDWVCCNDELYVYDRENGMWSNSTTSHLKVIKKYASGLFCINEKGEISIHKSYGNTLRLMEIMPKLLKTLCVNNNWMQQYERSGLGKLLFNNGYYDMKKGQFYPINAQKEFFTPEIVFFGKIHHDYIEPTKDDLIYIDYVKKTLFNTALCVEVGDFLLLNCARGLAGDMMKKIIFGLGEKNSGKSLTTKAIKLACGDYAGTFNTGNLIYKPNSTYDEAQKLRWLYLERYKRLLFSNEMKNETLDGNDIKRISSGGDELKGRVHGGLETEFTPHCLTVIFANDMPKIAPFDEAMNERTNVVSFKKSFVTKIVNEEYDLLKNDNFEDETRTLKFQQALINLFIITYNNYLMDSRNNVEYITPKAVQAAKTEWIAQDPNYVNSFLIDYEITNDINHNVKSKDIQKWLDINEFNITITKFTQDMKKHCSIKQYTNVISQAKKIDGKTCQVWIGIKSIGTNQINHINASIFEPTGMF